MLLSPAQSWGRRGDRLQDRRDPAVPRAAAVGSTQGPALRPGAMGDISQTFQSWGRHLEAERCVLARIGFPGWITPVLAQDRASPVQPGRQDCLSSSNARLKAVSPQPLPIQSVHPTVLFAPRLHLHVQGCRYLHLAQLCTSFGA